MKRPRRRHPLWWPGDEKLVCAAGDVISARIEQAARDELIDHVWIKLDTGGRVPVEASINTRSLKNEQAGFDSRIRAGVVKEKWESLPGMGVRALDGFDYAHVESEENVFYEHLDRSEMEELLVEKAGHCLRMEIWGMPYHRVHPGIHQIHSRRASSAVKQDVCGYDGGLRFFFERARLAELWMFKFCGQP